MRSIEPIALGRLAPADLAGQPGPDFDLVAPTSLLVDDAYQRGLSGKSLELIRRIVRTWSWAKFKPPICVRVDGRLHVVDGQHTAIAAASHGGISVIFVVIVAAPELVDRADAFVSHSTSCLAATPVQILRAQATAGDEDAQTVVNVCERAGVTLLPFAPPRAEYGPRQTLALGVIRRLIERHGAMRARQILEVVARSDVAPISADHIRLGEALMTDPACAADFDEAAVTEAVLRLDHQVYAEARELAVVNKWPTWRALARVLHRRRINRPGTAAHGNVVSLGASLSGRSALDRKRMEAAS